MPDLLDQLLPALEDRYAAPELIGEGGMAVVFRALDRKHDRVVAIKVLRPELGASVGAERFLSEIRLTANLQHPHILPLYDSGATGELRFYIMPFVEGESLRERLARDGTLPAEDALHVARGVAVALDYAHGRGIIHRDIKPENILLCAGEPIVADFGVAKAIAATDTGKTTPGFAIGTPLYMSPEQACGDPDIDGRSDIYSLGCVLFEALSGEAPFADDTPMAITARKLTEAPPSLAAARPLPPAIDALLAKALATKREDRFSTARELAQALAGGAYPLAAVAATASLAAAPEPLPRSLAVLPFVNQSGTADDEVFSDGLTDELIYLLGTVEGLHVVARTTAFALKGTPEDVRAIGRRLNIGAVLEGSVRRAGQRLRVTTQLVKTADGYQLWSGRFDRTLDDAFAVQDEIAGATVEALRSALLGGGMPARASAIAAAPPQAAPVPAAGAAPVKGHTPEKGAHELYLRGRYAWNLRTEDNLTASVEYLTRAVQLDPAYALAHAALADSYATLGVYGVRPPDAVMPLAEQAAERALALEPNLAEALTALGSVKAVYRWNWAEAENLFRRAIAARPSYATAHQWLAINCLTPQRRFDEARSELDEALRFDPLNPSIRVSRGLVAHFAGAGDEAVEAYRRAIEADPGFGVARYFMGRALAAAGRYQDAIAALGRAAELAGASPEITSALGYALAKAGRREEAQARLAELAARARERYVAPILLAHVALGLDDRARALDELERAVDERAVQLIWIGLRPSFRVLRDEPRFQAVLARMGLE